jgi:hypothetical protein
MQVGISEIREFYSKPSVEAIKTGNPTDNQRAITILGLTKDNNVSVADNAPARKIISGAGRVPIDAAGNEINIEFKNLTVEKYANDWQLVEGRVDYPIDLIIPLDNSGSIGGADVDFNGHAEFETTAIIIEPNDLKLRGRFNWYLPHAVEDNQTPIVESLEKEYLFNYYNFIDNYIDIEPIKFDLLDPAGFALNFNAGTNGVNGETGATQFSVVDKKMTLRLEGQLITPEDVTDIADKRVDYNFTEVDNPYYFTASTTVNDADIRIVDNSTIQLDGKTTTFDLSETESPEGMADLDWKGVFFNTFDVRFPTDFDESKQLTFDSEQNYSFTQNTTEIRAWIDAGGLDLKIEKHFSDNEAPTAGFNTFKDDVKDIILDVENNSVNSNSVFKGYVFIPVLHPTEHFNYTIAVGQTGLQVSFLDDALVNRTFTFNEENDMKVVATVKQAVFRNNNRLDLTVDLDWEYIQIGLYDVTGLKVWGNGEFGFGQANGFKGVTNVTGLLENAYEVTIDSLGAGMFNGNYAFNFIGSMKVGDTESGLGGTTNGSGAKFSIISAEQRSDSMTSTGENAQNWVKLEEESEIEIETPGKPVFFFPIGIYTSVVKAYGQILVMYNDSEWGNAFYGVINAQIKKPKPFKLDAKVLIGKKGETSYWFVELGLASDDKEEKKDKNGKSVKATKKKPTKKETYEKGMKALADKAGKPKPKAKTSIKLGKVEITEVRGRVYYHMSKDMTDCEIPNMENLVPMGATIGEGNIEISLPSWPDLSLPQIKLSLGWLTIPDLKKMLCNISRTGFKAILGSLPEPDFTYLNSKSAATDWVQIETKFPEITYTQLELMVPGMDWCGIVAGIPNIDWSDLIFNLNLINQFPDICEMTQYLLNKTFDEIQEQKPPSQAYFFENNILSPEEWVTLKASGPNITWRKAHELFPNNNWCELMIALPGIDWPSIWLKVGIPTLQFDMPDIMSWLKKWLKIDFPKLEFPDFNLGIPDLPDMPNLSLDLELPGIELDYVVDPSTLFGAMLMVRLQDVPTMGAMVMGSGELEFTINNSGGLKEISLKIEGGGLNPANPINTDKSMIKMLGCFHYGTESETFTAKIRVQAQEKICAQALIDLIISPTRIKLDIGRKEFPVMMQPGCAGWGALGWLNLDYTEQKTDIGIGLGLTYKVDLRTGKYDFGICYDLYGYFKAGAQIAVYAEAVIEDDAFELKKAGVTFGASVSIGVAASGFFCPFSNITIASAYMGGDLEYTFDTNNLYGAVSGEICVIGICVGASTTMDITIEM